MPKTGAPSKRRITVQYLEVGADTLAGIAGGRVEVSGGRELATALIIMATAHAVALVEGIAMLAESFLKRRYEAGLQEGREEAAQRAGKYYSGGRSGTGDARKPRPGANGLRNHRLGSSDRSPGAANSEQGKGAVAAAPFAIVSVGVGR